MNISARIYLIFLFCSSESSLTESLEHCENDLKSLHSSDDFDFQIVDMNDSDFKTTKIR